MRIGVNCFNLGPTIGGIKQYFLMLFDELLRHDHGNDYVFFWCPDNANELAQLASERWREQAVLLAGQRRIRRHLEGLDLFFCPLGALYPRPLPLPSVVMLPDIQEVFFPEFFTARALYARDRHFLASTRMADRVITISEFTKQTIVRHHHIPAEKVTVAHLCANPIFYGPSSATRAPARALPDSFILFPANFWQHKNHDALLQALRLLERERILPIDLVLTGHAVPNGYPVDAKAAEYGIAARVHNLGYVSTQELAYLYRHARMLVFPSRFEGFGIPLVEAMASGCPIAAADTTSIPEVTGPAALLFDPASPREIADAVARLWQDETLRQELSAAGKREAERFSPARVAEIHLEAFAQAVRTHSSRRYLWHRWLYAPYHAGWAELRRLQRAGLLPGHPGSAAAANLNEIVRPSSAR